MSEWCKVKFGDVVSFPPKCKLVKGEVYPYVELADVDIGFKYVYSSGSKEYGGSGSKFENGDTLFARITPSLENGKIAQIKNLDKTGFGSGEFFIFRGKDGVTDSDFIYYLSQTQAFKDNAINSMVGASGRQRADNKFVAKTEINLPPLPTQQKVAKILSNYDDLIENNLKRIKLLEESARLTYEEWFLRFRIDGKKLDIDSATGLPFGWELAELGDFLKFKKGKKADEIFEEKKNGLIKLLLLKGLGSGEYAYVEKSRHVIARRGDILMTMDGARSSVVFYSEDGAVGSTMSLVETGKLPKSYIYHYFKSTYKWLEINNTGAAIPHANKSFINKMKIVNPGDVILTKWNKNISHINDQVFNLKDQNQLLKEARDILLPRLMTNVIDTDDMDIAV